MIGIPYIATSVYWEVPNNGTNYSINIPIEGMRDDLNFRVNHPDIVLSVTNIKNNGYTVQINVPNTVGTGNYNITVVAPGGFGSDELAYALSTNGTSRIRVVNTGIFNKVGDDNIDVRAFNDDIWASVNNYSSLIFDDTKALTSVAADILVAKKIFLPKRGNMKSISLRYSTGVAGAAICGIYTIVGGIPKKLLAKTTAYDTSLTSSQQKNISPFLALEAGYYAAVYNANVANTINASSNANANPNWGSNPTILATNVYAAYQAAHVYDGDLPAEFPAGSLSVSTQNPYFIFQIDAL